MYPTKTFRSGYKAICLRKVTTFHLSHEEVDVHGDHGHIIFEDEVSVVVIVATAVAIDGGHAFQPAEDAIR